jgi:Na+/phosphate symporter
MTDQQSQQWINEAAEQFTDALVESFKTVTERGASAQEQGAQLTEDFFNRVVENLRTQAEESRQATQQLADQQQRQAEAAQTLTRESVEAYMDFMNSMFSWWQGGVQTAERGARETEKAAKGKKS